MSTSGGLGAYVLPVPRPCQHCGEQVIAEYGTFDAEHYANGSLYNHNCVAHALRTPNERDFCARCGELVWRENMPDHESPHDKKAARPAPPRAAARRPKPFKAPPENGGRGGVQI